MEDSRPLIVNAGDVDNDFSNGEPPDTTIVKNKGCCSIPCRYTLTALMTFGFFCAFAQRMVFNISLVAMVNLTESANTNYTSGDCPVDPNSINSTAISQPGEFNWNADLQGLLLSAFFYGYPISQLPFGYLAERFGGKIIFGISGLTTGILSLLIPIVARWNPYALIVLRAVQGLFQGALYPTCLAMFSRWGPPKERNTIYTIVNAGAIFGSVLSMVVSGVMCQSTFLGGWPSTFYLFGGLSVLWSIVWILVAHDTPAVHPRITSSERDYITKETESLATVKYTSPPWGSIVKSVPVWGILIIICTDNFGFYITFSCLPMFMKQVLHFDMSQNGLLSALPYIVQFPIGLFVGAIADGIFRRRLLRRVNIRRGSAILGEFMPGVFILLVGFFGCNRMAVIAMLMLSLGSNAILLAGPVPSMFDIAPLYSGSLMGVLNGIGNIFGIIAPIIVAHITGDSGDQTKWRTVFYISAMIYTFGAIVYCTLITDKEQHWAKERRDTEKQDTDGTQDDSPTTHSIST